MKSLPTLLLAIMWIGACLAAPAQIQTAGNLLVDLDPAIAPAGPISWITNAGTLGGVLQATGLTAQDQPLVAPIGGGRIGPGGSFSGANFVMLTQIENYRDWHRAEIANDGFNGGGAWTASNRAPDLAAAEHDGTNLPASHRPR